MQLLARSHLPIRRRVLYPLSYGSISPARANHGYGDWNVLYCSTGNRNCARVPMPGALLVSAEMGRVLFAGSLKKGYDNQNILKVGEP